MIGEREGLIAGGAYDLLVDIGPRWSKAESIVRGHAEFPAEALPPDADGHEIDVLMSDDFVPAVVAGRLWLPRSSGRSQPWTEAGPASESGPIALRVTAPVMWNPRARTRRALGRLLVYHEQNLLQSALVSVVVIREPDVKVDRPNRIDVDYVLTGTFTDIGARFGRRLPSPGVAPVDPAVRVNITLNSGGSGTHRVIVQGRDELPVAWTAYDPSAAKHSLGEARRSLLECYWERLPDDGAVRVDAQGDPIAGLDPANGKPWRQFLLDLFVLARVGNRLYGEMLHSVRPADDSTSQVGWERSLRTALTRSSVIQIARIDWTPAQYAFPWALLYEYPLPGTPAELRYCDVVKEWGEDGRRSLPVASACPFAAEPRHARDVVCPYGFWGLKHVIEQPVSTAPSGDGRALRDAVKAVRISSQARVSMGWTPDAALDLASVDRHFERLGRSAGLRLAEPPPNPADDRATVGALLARADLVYFLCHCEKTVDQNQRTCTSERATGASRKVYASTITDWARLGLADWLESSPIAIINGCHTSDVAPGEVLNFVSAFALAGAAGVLGTEVSVQFPVAVEVGERLIQKLVDVEDGTVGQALREVRWELANKGNLLGLTYGAYGLADLGFVHEA